MGTAGRIVIAVAAIYLIFRMGLAVLKSFAQPVPEPPRHCMEEMEVVAAAE